MEPKKVAKKIHHGEWVRNLMNKFDLTFEAVGDMVGKDPSTIHRWTTSEKIDMRKLKSFVDHIDIDLRDHFENVDYLYLTQPKIKDEKYNDLLIKYTEVLEKYSSLQEAHSKCNS